MSMRRTDNRGNVKHIYCAVRGVLKFSICVSFSNCVMFQCGHDGPCFSGGSSPKVKELRPYIQPRSFCCKAFYLEKLIEFFGYDVSVASGLHKGRYPTRASSVRCLGVWGRIASSMSSQGGSSLVLQSDLDH